MPGSRHLQGQLPGNEPRQQGVEVKTVLLPIKAGTVYLSPVREVIEEELIRSVQDEIGAGALTPVPSERSTLPEYDPRLDLPFSFRSQIFGKSPMSPLTA